MQPYLFPYIGYFQLINAADIFILYDDVNFRKQSWINRNRILLNGSIHTFTIPCKGISSNKLIKEIELNNKQDFEHNFLELLGHGYEKKAPYFDNKEDHDGSEASVSVLSCLSLYPVISIDHNFAVKPSPFFPDFVSL